MDFVRYEFVTAYNFAESWDAWLRMPYDVKNRTANVELVDPATQEEIAAMQRHLDLHHPTAVLEGFGDFSLLLAKRQKGVLREGDILAAAFGTTIPVGKTEDNPYVLGDSELAHEHIQFGTGTFDPLLEFYYSTPISSRVSVSANVRGRFPLYENDKGYQGPGEFSSDLNLALAPTDRLGLRLGWSFFYQNYAHWDGERDINSGLISNGIVGGVNYRASDGAYLSIATRVPVSQETLSDSGDNFELGTIVQIELSYSF